MSALFCEAETERMFEIRCVIFPLDLQAKLRQLAFLLIAKELRMFLHFFGGGDGYILSDCINIYIISLALPLGPQSLKYLLFCLLSKSLLIPGFFFL